MRGDGKVKRNCQQCASEFHCWPSRIKYTGAKYCSRKCHDISSRTICTESKQCRLCSKTVYRKSIHDDKMWAAKNYCSVTCRNTARESRMIVPCAYCGDPIEGKSSRFNHGRGTKRYCSKECGGKGRTAPISEVIKRAAVTYLSPRMIDQYGDKKCAICGFDRFIEFAHIVPRRDGGTVHPDNILALCPNHHRLFDRSMLTSPEVSTIQSRLNKAKESPNSKFQMQPEEAHA